MKKTLIILLIITFVKVNLYSQNNSASNYNSFRYNKTTFYYDDFSDNQKSWTTGRTESKFKEIKNGKYYLEALTETNSQTANNVVDLDNSKDFEIEALIKVTGGDDSRGQALLWGISSNPYEDYGYLFTQNGQFEITNYKNNTYNKYKDWTVLNNYKKSQFNKLTIRKYSNQYYFFFNEELVYQMPFVKFYGNRIGFEVGKKSSIEVDYLKVSYLNGTPQPEVGNTSPYYEKYSGISNSSKISLLKEDFNNAVNEWVVKNSDEVSLMITNGNYRFQSKAGFYRSIIPLYINQQGNFEIEARYKVTQSEKEFENCIMWGCDSKNSYRFGVTKSGYFTIYKMNPGVVDYVDYTKLANFNKFAYNKLTIRKFLGKLYFFINEKLVHSMNFEAFFDNKIGFLVGKNATMEIDYLYVYKLN